MNDRCRTLVLAAVLSAWVGTAAALRAQEKPEKKIAGPSSLISAARAQYESGVFERAAQLAELFVRNYRDDPRLGDMYLLWAESLVGTGAFDNARDVLDELLRLFDAYAKHPRVLELYGDTYAGSFRKRLEAARRYRASASAFEAEGSRASAARVLHKLALLYAKYDVWPARAGDDVPSEASERNRIRADLVFSTVDRMIEVAPDDEIIGRAHLLRARMLAGRYVPDLVAARRAVAAYDAVLETAGESELAAAALFESAAVAQRELGDYADAERRLETLLRKWGAARQVPEAQRMLKNMRRPRLTVQWEEEAKTDPGNGIRSGRLRWQARNVNSIRLSAYRVDLFELVRGVQRLSDLRAWKPEGEPDASWRVDVPDDGTHRYFSSDDTDQRRIAVPLGESGTFVVEAEAGGVRSRTFGLISRIRAVSKRGKRRSWVRVVDAASGRGVEGASVLMQRAAGPAGFSYREGKTDASGIVYTDWSPNGKGRVVGSVATFVQHGPEAAVVREGPLASRAERRGPFRVYGWTDRAAYRPGDTIRFKQIVRTFAGEKYGNWANRPVKLALHDPAGKPVAEQTLPTNANGCAWGQFALGENIKGGVHEIVVTIGDYVITPEVSAGNRIVVISPESAGKDDAGRRSKRAVSVSTGKNLYRPGDPVDVHLYVSGTPEAGDHNEAVLRVWTTTEPLGATTKRGRVLVEQAVRLDATGRGVSEWSAGQEGAFVISAESARGASASSGETVVWVVDDGETMTDLQLQDLHLVPDRKRYAQDAVGRFLVLSGAKDGSVWVTGEADEVLFSRTLELRNGVGSFEIPMAAAYVPGFDLRATIVREGAVSERREAIAVSDIAGLLRVVVQADDEGRRVYAPGAPATFRVICGDASGNGAAAELAVRLVDGRSARSAESAAPSDWPHIAAYFHGQGRSATVRTDSEFAPQASARTAKTRDRPRDADGADDAAAAAPETLSGGLWLANVATNEKGQAELTISMPEAQASWRLEVIAVDERTRVGAGALELSTK